MPAHSSAESELIAASEAMREAVWLSNVGKSMGVHNPINMYIDNKAAVDIANAKALNMISANHFHGVTFLRILRGIPRTENLHDTYTKFLLNFC